jgi:protein TonB
MSATLPSPTRGFSQVVLRPIKRMGPLGAIVLAHVVFFYSLQSGLLRQASQAVLPKEVFATFIAPDRVLESPKPQPAAPKTVPIVKKAVTPPTQIPAVNTTPSPQAIVAAPAAPSSEPIATAVAAPPAPAAPAQPGTIVSGIEYIQAPQPAYPSISKRMGEEGKVILRILVNERGRAERVEVQKSSGSPRLDDAARQAVLRAIFKPFVEDGKPVMKYAIVPITFQLDN